jgi:hypothetical protein
MYSGAEKSSVGYSSGRSMCAPATLRCEGPRGTLLYRPKGPDYSRGTPSVSRIAHAET